MSFDYSYSEEEEEEEEEEGEEVLKWRKEVINPTVVLVAPIIAPVIPILASSSNLEDSDNWVFALI